MRTKFWASIKGAYRAAERIFLRNNGKIFFAALILTFLSGCAARSVPKDKFRNVYEIYVGSFYDANGDGMGDLRGVTEKLDYIANPKEGLGADAVWMMPVNPSPSYHKYDVTDYKAIDPEYGTMEDFDALSAECDRRGVMLIMDLVLNHTSKQHPWFQEAMTEIREGKELNYAKYYNFSPEKLGDSYYALTAGSYYEAVFWDQMPDLNMDSEKLREEIEGIVKFWLDKGVDGFRLDAAMHVYHTEEENLSFWKWFSEMCKNINPDVYLVAEVWDNDAAILPYYTTGLDSLFNFGFAEPTGAVAKAVNTGNGQEFANRVAAYGKLVKDTDADAVMANFLSNHDNDRSAGYIRGGEAGRKLAAAAYMLMPGSSYIYYGEEISLTGKGKDENKRMPFVWSMSDGTGLTKGPAGGEKQTLEEGAAEQLARKDSLFNAYRAIIAVKNKYPAIARGTASAVETKERSIGAYEITYGEESITVAHNFSDGPVSFALPEGKKYKLTEKLNAVENQFKLDGNVLTVPGLGTALLTF